MLSAVTTQHVMAQPLLISITANGQVEGTNTIQRNGNVYTLTSNLEEGSIVIEASDIVLDGSGFTLGEIYRINGDNVEIKNLKINAEVNAIEIYGSNCKILDNEIYAKYIGIRIRESDNNIISGNKIDTEAGVGIGFETSNDNKVTDNNVNSKVFESVSLSYSDKNTFSKNTLNFVSLYKSSYNIFNENSLPQGIYIRSSSDYNQITGNNITDFNKLTDIYFGSSGSITLFSCKGNVISSNIITNSGGIFLDTASNNILRSNFVESAETGFEVSGSPQPSLSSFINDIDDSNTINGKKIYYLTNKTDLTVNPLTYPNAGYLALVNCKRITVENMHLNTQGIMLAFTTASQIKDNDISYNSGDGVTLTYASNNKIDENNISENRGVGMILSYSNQNEISGNQITKNQIGISFIHSVTNNTIAKNNIADQDTGFYLYISSDNFIYNNNFVNNTKPVYDAYWETRGNPFSYVLPSENIWDNGLLSEGNYWSNYTNQYPNAKELDGSGIWDVPLVIDENNQDRYPLVNPVIIPELPDGAGNNGTDETESFPTTLVAGSVILLAAVGIGLLVYFKKSHIKSGVKRE